jgi:hypothetical protein
MVAFIPTAKPTGRCFESKSKQGAHRVTHLFDPFAFRDIAFIDSSLRVRDEGSVHCGMDANEEVQDRCSGRLPKYGA